MFGGRRLVWLRNVVSGKEIAEAVGRLDAAPLSDAALVVEAGELRKGAPLRNAFETARHAMALPCYADDDRSVDRVLDGALAAAGLRMTLEARQAFKALLGGDRLATRGEIEKLLLYCEGAAEIGIDDVTASAGDVSALSLDGIVDAVLAGEPARFDRAFTRSLAAGATPHAILSALMRQMQQLQLLRNRMEREGTTAAAAVASARPAVFFARRGLMTAALAAWDGAGLARVLSRLREAVLETRGGGALAAAACHRALLATCLETARLARSGRR
jgi:DNA polymerase-3 subunit delta